MTAISPIILWWSVLWMEVGVTWELKHLQYNFEIFHEYTFDFNLSKITYMLILVIYYHDLSKYKMHLYDFKISYIAVVLVSSFSFATILKKVKIVVCLTVKYNMEKRHITKMYLIWICVYTSITHRLRYFLNHIKTEYYNYIHWSYKRWES